MMNIRSLRQFKRHVISNSFFQAALILISFAYLVSRLVYRPSLNGIDFRLIWLAGRLWASKLTPYGHDFLTYYLPKWGVGPPTHFWVYPPSWYWICRFLALFPFEISTYIWGTLSIAATSSSVWLLGAAYADWRTPENRGRIAILSCGLFFSHSALWNLGIGQTSALPLFALSLLVYADRISANIPIVLGLVIVLLKPNIGIFVCIFYAFRGNNVRDLVIVAALSLLLCLPSFYLFGFDEVKGFLSATSRYGAPEMWANNFSDSTGVVQVLSFMKINQSGFARLFLTVTMALCSAALGIATKTETIGRPMAILSLLISILIPLHSYDQMILFIPISYVCFSSGFTLSSLIGSILLIRPLNVSKIAHLGNPYARVFLDSPLYLIAAVLLLISIFWAKPNSLLRRVKYKIDSASDLDSNYAM